jgi:hypothetical protein
MCHIHQLPGSADAQQLAFDSANQVILVSNIGCQGNQGHAVRENTYLPVPPQKQIKIICPMGFLEYFCTPKNRFGSSVGRAIHF